MLVSVYGNRAYEDALLEMFDIAKDSRFILITASAFIGEHSYSTKSLKITQGNRMNTI